MCGHNITDHDVKYLEKSHDDFSQRNYRLIDTLYLSPLLFPRYPYHKLIKDDKIHSETVNNPLNDALKAKDLFYEELNAFHQLDTEMQDIFYLLLSDSKYFSGFFEYMEYGNKTAPAAGELISRYFQGRICSRKDLHEFISSHPLALAYCLALINVNDSYSITPPWVLMNFPEVEKIMFSLRSQPCLEGCDYCNSALDPHLNLQKYFGFESFRSYEGEALQENAVKAALNNESILTVFPTGGGKSLTFQLPALVAGEYSKGLTVVISPLQSLMKDQVDNLERSGITDAVTINGLLDPIERSKALKRIEGFNSDEQLQLANLLYISPESLRSKTIENLLLCRKISRFVIDEAHCFSSWGHDFRVDYLYIGEFIKNLQEKKNLQESIPVSCFTATAKQQVVEDIRNYFRKKLNLELKLFRTDASRKNLSYRIIHCKDESQKYPELRNLLIYKDCPSIIYVSSIRKTEHLAQHLKNDGFAAAPYHGQMESHQKQDNQNAFINGEVQVMVATSAFGMGVDKKDVGMVIHYEISDSLENYVQEAGRAGRDEKLKADCFVLFNEDDLNHHFSKLNSSRLDIKDIKQIWSSVKELTKASFESSKNYRKEKEQRVCSSALEIARRAGWDENMYQLETRVTTAISALEESGYLKRVHNSPGIFATGILVKTADEAIAKINNSPRFQEKEKEYAIRIIKKLISAKSRKNALDEDPESRVDYIAEHLELSTEMVIRIIDLLKEEKILANTEDISAFINAGDSKYKSEKILENFAKIERFLFENIDEEKYEVHVKELNEKAVHEGIAESNPVWINIIFNFWAIKNWIKKETNKINRHHIRLQFNESKKSLEAKLENRLALAKYIITFLYTRAKEGNVKAAKDDLLVEFSIHELKEEYEKSSQLFKKEISLDDVKDALFYLSKIEAFRIEGGFMVVYNRLNILRLEKNNKVQFKEEDYEKLRNFYKGKIQQIHIVGEYAKKMINDYTGALNFVDDYFQLNYSSFLRKYFPTSTQRENLERGLTPAQFKKIFGELSPRQLDIIKDKDSKYIVVAAGPGSGKTRILVHKLASLLMIEEIRPEQLLMLTFSRAAATEFKFRLRKLVQNTANYVEIKTFHSYAFDLLGEVGSLEKSGDVIKKAIQKIKNREIENSRITKTALVIDEAQDMDKDEYLMIEALMDYNEEMRVIAVGDDDQNIYEFRGSRSGYFARFISERKAKKYELTRNYRSYRNLVEFAGQFVEGISGRLKTEPLLAHHDKRGRIEIRNYQSDKLIIPLVQNILRTPLKGTACVLTHTNDEALKIAGLLNLEGQPARLIQSNEGFNLIKLYEVKFFLERIRSGMEGPVIPEERWEKSKRFLKEGFRNSRVYPSLESLIDRFERLYKIKYISDLEQYILESKLEDFTEAGDEKIIVSTMHKAKGKEFDNVFLLLTGFYPDNDEKKRLVYVSVTRARKNLYIHNNIRFAEDTDVEGLERFTDTQQYPAPERISIQLAHKDLNLGYFEYVQQNMINLKSGDELIINDEGGCSMKGGKKILKFSKNFLEEIESLGRNGYRPCGGIVSYMVYWKDKDVGGEFLIVLPEVVFERGKGEGKEEGRGKEEGKRVF